MKNKYITKSCKQTQKLGEEVAQKILKQPLEKNAVVLGLMGNLGGGKTTFLQGFAKGLKIKEKILSPTFVILKHFKINKSVSKQFRDYYHIDCYRLNDGKDILEMDFKKIIFNSENIVAIEWSEKVKKLLPRDSIVINFKFVDKNKREINFD